MRRSLILALACASLCGASVACSALLGLEPPPDGGTEDAGADSTATDGTTGSDGAGHDGPSFDGTTTDGGIETGSDAGLDAPSDAPACLGLDAGDGSTTYYALKNGSLPDGGDVFEFYEPDIVNANAHGFIGGTFDGRFLYLAPYDDGTIARFDTHATFNSTAAWSFFDATVLSPDAQGFAGALFDGRFVYMVPQRGSPSSTTAGVVVRYDTQAGQFTKNGPQWATFDLTTLPVSDAGTLTGFSGGAFDGNALYFVPNHAADTYTSRVVRYEPDAGAVDAGAGTDAATDAGDGGDAGAGDAAPFATASQFTTYDLTAKNNTASGYRGGVFDGRYVYVVPGYGNQGGSGIVARYDTTETFGSSAAWSAFDLTTLSPRAVEFSGAVFDGRFVYLVPQGQGLVARFDTSNANALAHVEAWSTFDLTALVPSDAGAPSFAGGAFDGRFVYFVPNGAGFGTLVRYDTWSTFGSDCAWSSVDLPVSSGNASATNFFGAIYDGQYLYLVPRGTYVGRFATKTTSAMPVLPGFSGSFF
ncbi:MAG TPA: hypothetical protein VGG39_33960 [Polyangiaceae bacterium]|jgi:hypothetical protein